LDARMLRSICCVKWLFLLLFLASNAQAQFISPNTGGKFGGFNADQSTPTQGPTSTATWDPMYPTYTPSPTPTFNPFATAGTSTDTVTSTFTATQTGTIYTPTPTWTSTPNISRASLVLLPTAYSNARDHWDGFNWDIDFTYFIGSIVSADYTQPKGNQFDSLEEINVVLLTNDFKYAWLNDDGDMPGMASGLMTSLLAQVGTSSSAAATTSQTFQIAGNVIGGVYTVMSKTVAKDTAVHFGYIYGLEDLGQGFFGANYSSLLPYFGPGLNNSLGGSLGEGPDSLYYMGFNTRFLDRNWKFEIWKPFPMDHSPILFNTLIDGLPLAFNIGYERWDTGYAVLGYVNFRIPLLPADSAY
jgi:hypothetical protein